MRDVPMSLLCAAVVSVLVEVNYGNTGMVLSSQA
jgi:hypothetical protein